MSKETKTRDLKDKMKLFYFKNSYEIDTLTETLIRGLMLFLIFIIFGSGFSLGIWIIIKALKALGLL